jgi:Protein of unknown function (DUF3147)
VNGHLLPKVEPGAIAKHGPMDYVSRFLFGAGISLAAGLIGMKFGPVVGGVFLGFPAILPASLTLIEKKDGKQQAAIDSEGAVLGAMALVVYAVVVVVTVSKLGVVASLVVALLAWLAVAVGLYFAAVVVLRREPSPP